MAMAKKAAAKKTVAKKTVAKKTVKKADDWSNDMTKAQKGAAKKAFSRKMSWDRGAPNGVLAQDQRDLNSRWGVPAKFAQQEGRSLIKSSKKNAAKAAKNPSDMRSAKSVGYTKGAAVQAYASATRRSTKRKRGE